MITNKRKGLFKPPFLFVHFLATVFHDFSITSLKKSLIAHIYNNKTHLNKKFANVKTKQRHFFVKITVIFLLLCI